MNRGCRGDQIYLDDDDRLFLNVLEEAVELWQVHICGYCLMPNHYHLLVQTPEANLSRCLRHQFLNRKNLPSSLRSKEFANQIRHPFFNLSVHPEKPAAKELAIESKRIITLVCRHFGIHRRDIIQQKRGVSNTPRDLANYLIRNKSVYKLEEIAEIFLFSNDSGASSAIGRVKKQIEADSTFAATVKVLWSQIG